MKHSIRAATHLTVGLALVGAAAVAVPANAADNGDLIVFTRAGDLWTMPAAGGEMTQLTETGNLKERIPSWTSDGTSVRYVRSADHGDGEVWQIDLDGSDNRRISPEGLLVDDVDWSPDGSRVTFTQELPTNPKKNQTQQDVFVANADFSDIRNVSDSAGRDANPDFGPDGSIAFSSQLQRGRAVFVVADEEGAVPTQVSDPREGGSFPTWSPDGTQLVYMEYVGPSASWGLRIYDLETGAERRLTTGGSNEWHPEFSPDGTEVVFAHGSGTRKDQWHLRKVVVADSVDGPAESTRLTQDDSWGASQPSWQPKPAGPSDPGDPDDPNCLPVAGICT